MSQGTTVMPPALVDEVARQMIAQHMDDCGRRYEVLREEQAQRHGENSRRLDAVDRTLTRINQMTISALVALLTALGSLIVLLIRSGGHL